MPSVCRKEPPGGWSTKLLKAYRRQLASPHLTIMIKKQGERKRGTSRPPPFPSPQPVHQHARFDRSKNSTFSAPSGPLAADEDGERTSVFSKPAALRGLNIAFGLTFTTPSGMRSTLFTTGRTHARSAERPSRKLICMIPCGMYR